MIEESGENWWYDASDTTPRTIEVHAVVSTLEEWNEPRERKKAKKPKKPKPFGFARALKPK